MRIDFNGGKVPLLIGLIAVIGGMWVKLEVEDADGILLIGIGCLLLGIWLVQFVTEWMDELRKPPPPDDDKEEPPTK